MEDAIVPSIKTTLEPHESNSAEIQDLCLFVFNEVGKWEAMKKLRNKYNAYWDGAGYLIDIKHKKEVEDFCKQYNLVCIEHDAPENINDLPYYDPIILLEQQLETKKREIKSLLYGTGVEYNDIDDLYNENIKKQIEDLPNGDKILKLIFQQYQPLQKKITWLENKRLISNNSKDYDVSQGLLKTTDSIKASQNSSNEHLEFLLEHNSEKILIEELQSILPGTPTGFKIGEVDLTFPGGAISIIAAPTSHGKTSALINFCLGALNSNHDQYVHFFTYEESTASILISFLNTWLGEEITKGNNKNSIINYFRDNSTKFIKESMKALFIEKKKSFFDMLINNGRLKIFYSDMTVNDLIEAIHFIKKKVNTSLICIDYMQLLKLSNNFRSSRQEELKEICLMLKDCAVETGLPIVLAAQFNRTVVAEADLSPVNIGEAGDIERVASLIIGMYNRNFHLSKIGNIDKNGKPVEKESSIYFEILKGRSIGNGHNTVMKFDGNTGKLTSISNTSSTNTKSVF